jgi:hypothetical protein
VFVVRGVAGTLDTRRSVTIWCQRQRIGGDGAVAARRDPGLGASLRREQELELVGAIRDRFPEELGFGGELWTRQSLGALVVQRFEVELGAPTLGRYLRAWGLVPDAPEDRACPLCAAAVAQWMGREYVAVARAALEQRAELYWVGRTRLHGVSPATEVLSAVSARGWVRFLILSAGAPPGLGRKFLLGLSGTAERPTQVIVDGSWSSAEWPRRLPRRIVLHALPSCERT